MNKVLILPIKYNEIYMHKAHYSKLVYFFLTVNLGFAEVSSPEEWIETGEKFMKKSLFNTAATCFREAGEFEMEKIAKCHQKALDASKYVQKINFIIIYF